MIFIELLQAQNHMGVCHLSTLECLLDAARNIRSTIDKAERDVWIPFLGFVMERKQKSDKSRRYLPIPHLAMVSYGSFVILFLAKTSKNKESLNSGTINCACPVRSPVGTSDLSSSAQDRRHAIHLPRNSYGKVLSW